MMYTGRCPHCGNEVRGGHGIPIKSIDTPFRQCNWCGRTYIDENMYEWAVLDPIYKFSFYFLANNRWVPYCLFLILSFSGYWVAALICSIIWPVISYIYVKLAKKEDIEASYIRCEDSIYVESLVKNYKKVEMRKRIHAIIEENKRNRAEALANRERMLAEKKKEQALLIPKKCINCKYYNNSRRNEHGLARCSKHPFWVKDDETCESFEPIEQ